MRLLVDENVPGLDRFAEFGELRTLPGRMIAREHLADVDALVLRSVTRVDRALLVGTPVRFVGTATAGTDHVAVADLQALGIAFASAPGSNADSVVDYVIAVLASRFETLDELRACRVGIVGHGQVGGRLCVRLAALGVACRVRDPFLPASSVPGLGSLDAALQADVVSLHVPLTLDGPHPTLGMIGVAELERLPAAALLVQTSRGGVLDEAALHRRLQRGDGLQCALDVWESEPDIDPQLLRRARWATPHIAGYAWDGKLRGAAMIHAALARHLGRAASSWKPEGDAPCLDVSGMAPLEVVRRCYPVDEDACRFRARVAEQGIAGAFDAERRCYPRRREFSAWRLGGLGELDPAARTALAALGFTVAQVGA